VDVTGKVRDDFIRNTKRGGMNTQRLPKLKDVSAAMGGSGKAIAE
jgi:hypothetical protein